jgi:hypothetical protein
MAPRWRPPTRDGVLQCPGVRRQIDGIARHAEAALSASPDVAPNRASGAAWAYTLSLILIVRRRARRLPWTHYICGLHDLQALPIACRCKYMLFPCVKFHALLQG